MGILNWCRVLPAIGIVAWSMAGISGCGARPNYTPRADVAEDAVRRSLEAWKTGIPAGPVPETKPVIQITDNGRKPGQMLESYEILGETRGTSGRSFAVNLVLANPAETIKTKYLVVGIDPLWVFRQEDYELLVHWDHHMPDAESAVDDAQESFP